MKNQFPNTPLQVLLLLAVSLVLASPIVIVKENFNNGDFLAFLFLPVFVIIAVLVAKLLNKNREKNVLTSKFAANPNKRRLFLLLTATIIVVFQTMINPFLSSLISTFLFKTKAEVPNFSTMYVLSLLLLAPFFEELLFRKVIFTGLLSKYNVNVSILVSSVFFALIHFMPSQIIGAFFLGIVLGLLYYLTADILYPIVYHAMANAVGLFMVVFRAWFKGSVLLDSTIFHIVVIILGIVILLFPIRKLVQIMHKTINK